jgi:hypothetical protein
MAITSNLVTTSGSAIYTAPGTIGSDDREYAVTCMMFCNYDPINDVTLDLYLLAPLPAAISNTNKIIHELVIPAGETFTFDTEKLVLATGERIWAEASANTRLSVSVTSMRVS